MRNLWGQARWRTAVQLVTRQRQLSSQLQVRHVGTAAALRLPPLPLLRRAWLGAGCSLAAATAGIVLAASRQATLLRAEAVVIAQGQKPCSSKPAGMAPTTSHPLDTRRHTSTPPLTRQEAHKVVHLAAQPPALCLLSQVPQPGPPSRRRALEQPARRDGSRKHSTRHVS